MVGAPNRIKQPKTTVAPRRTVNLPSSSEKPTHATAMTAIAVPIGPTSRSTTHCTAAWGWLGPDNVYTAKSEFMIRQLPLHRKRMQLGSLAPANRVLIQPDSRSPANSSRSP